MDGSRESDRFIVPRKPSNKGRAQGTGGEGGGEGSGPRGAWSSIPGTGRRAGVSLSQVLDCIRQAPAGVCAVAARGRSPVR